MLEKDNFRQWTLAGYLMSKHPFVFLKYLSMPALLLRRCQLRDHTFPPQGEFYLQLGARHAATAIASRFLCRRAIRDDKK